MITLLSLKDPFVNLYAGYPFFQYKKKKFIVVNTTKQALKQNTACLILLRWFGDADLRPLEQKIDELKLLKDHFKKIIFVDADDSASTNLTFVLPYVDLYWKKQLYKNRQEYLKPQYGNRLFAQYYHDNFGIEEVFEPYPSFGNPQDLKKLKVCWNLGVGSYPVRNKREKLSHLLYQAAGPKISLLPFSRPKLRQKTAKEVNLCHARFSAKGYSPTIACQRDLFGKLLDNKKEVLRGFIDRKVYEKEMRSVTAVLSPFGWGEVCYRDFEAIMNSAVLIKPDMGHLETWPQVYVPWETYVPVAWDGSDLLENIQRVLQMSSVERLRISQNAWEVWNRSFQELSQRLDLLLEDL